MHTISTQNIVVKNERFKMAVVTDPLAGLPWENMDTLGTVSDWTTRDKRAGERVINSERGMARFYDYQGAIAKAKSEGMTGYAAVKAVDSELEYFKSWCEDRWEYVGVVVSKLCSCCNQPSDTVKDSLWSIESSDEGYLKQVAEELAEGLLHVKTKDLHVI